VFKQWKAEYVAKFSAYRILDIRSNVKNTNKTLLYMGR